MFDIGFLEMTTIGIVALIVIGPERLPAVAAKVGRYVGKAQRFVRGVRSDISRELETGDLKALIGDQKNQIDELRQMMNTATKDIQASTKDTFKDVENSLGDLKSTVTDATSETRVDVPAASTSTAESIANRASDNDAGANKDVEPTTGTVSGDESKQNTSTN